MTDISTYGRRVGKQLRAVRRAQGMSMNDVQELSGGRFKAVVVGSWERADRRVSAENLARYAEFLGVDMRDLLPPAESTAAWRWQYSMASQAAAKAVRELTELCRIAPADARALLTTALARPRDTEDAQAGEAA